MFAWPSVSVKRGAILAIQRKVVKIEWEKTWRTTGEGCHGV